MLPLGRASVESTVQLLSNERPWAARSSALPWPARVSRGIADGSARVPSS